MVGDWPGLAKNDLCQGRDLEVTTDFRDLFTEVAGSALGLAEATELSPDHVAARRIGAIKA